MCRDIVTILKLEGPNYNGPFSPKKLGPKYTLPKYQKIGPLGNYTPDCTLCCGQLSSASGDVLVGLLCKEELIFLFIKKDD